MLDKTNSLDLIGESLDLLLYFSFENNLYTNNLFILLKIVVTNFPVNDLLLFPLKKERIMWICQLISKKLSAAKLAAVCLEKVIDLFDIYVKCR